MNASPNAAATSSCLNRDIIASAINAQLDRCMFASAEWLSDLVDNARDEAEQWLAQPTSRTDCFEATAADRRDTRLSKARALFGQHEYQRCCFALTDSKTSHNLESDCVVQDHEGAKPSSLRIFYALYSHFLDGERAKDRGLDSAGSDRSQTFAGISATSVGGALGAEDPGILPASEVQALYRRNPHLASLRRSLERCLIGRDEPTADVEVLSEVASSVPRHMSNDPYLFWLYGVVLRHIGSKEEAIGAQLEALKREPFLRAAWEELLPLVSTEEQIAQVLSVLQHSLGSFPFVARIWAAQLYQELHLFGPALEEFDILLRSFPNSVFLKARKAKCLHDKKEVEAARRLYESVHRDDPYRLELMDDYSNVLFVLNAKLELAQLAIDCQNADVYRAETNCVLGNYYGLTRRHELSLQHFRRAVAVDPLCVSAWTLMGHEYVEVKNTNAAIEAYRSAVAIDERDYRAWYGLGQVYELLGMYYFALHYYWRTTIVRPNDARMWAAVAGCLEKEKRHLEALQCLERAESCEPNTTSYYVNLLRRLAEGYLNLPSPHPAALSAPAMARTTAFPSAFDGPASAQVHPAHSAYSRYSSGFPPHEHRGSASSVSSTVSRCDKAAKFYEKLLSLESCPREETIRVTLFLVRHYTDQAKSLLHVPNRAPSFDPEERLHTEGSERPSQDRRNRHAAAALQTAEVYLARLSGDGAETQELSSLKKEIDYARLYLKE